METTILFFISLLAVSYMYSMVGHGGASGYLAVMSIFAISTVFFRSSALILNLFVAGIAFFNFQKGYKIRWGLFLPFLIPAIPMAFIGALIHIDAGTYKFILGVLLFLALLRLLYRPSREYDLISPPGILISGAIGATLGLLSGMIGIGGGIILSPIFILMRWSHVKETGVYSSLFILCNSLAGLIGLGSDGILLPPDFVYWIAVVVGGGLLGSVTAIKFLAVRYFKISLAIVLLFACFKLLVP
ncbi:MAG: sulfite exporter TauE/SafE family protein [Bacteroidales bacterium]|nr:sulfite exporter TauE/SafE family protein [Bacteroidales bacterium]